jgi:Flp pilus assembly pilin Flp
MFLDLYVKAKTFLWGVRDGFTREDGAVATEYGLLLALVALAIIAALIALAAALKVVFTNSATELGTVH